MREKLYNQHFNCQLEESGDEIWELIGQENEREKNTLSLIASENFASKAVLEAQGSLFTNKYAEGYPGRRYYNGCGLSDRVESLAIERACKLFGSKYANVQPHSGSQANQAAFSALLSPKDPILSLSLDCGGHLTHGSPVNMSGKFFNISHYRVQQESGLVDMEEVRRLAKEHKPKLIVAGASAYMGNIDFAEFRRVADEVGAYLLADVAHYAGLITAGCYPSPFPHAHIVTSTTHKTLRGPRGGLILTNDEDLSKKINSAIFPGFQGGPLMHVIAAKAVAFDEALRPEFKVYAQQVIKNAQALANRMLENGVSLVSKETKCHMVLIDLRSENVTGKEVSDALEKCNIVANKNGIPFDTKSPSVTSGLRVGSAAETTRGMMESDFVLIADLITQVIRGVENQEVMKEVRAQVASLLEKTSWY